MKRIVTILVVLGIIGAALFVITNQKEQTIQGQSLTVNIGGTSPTLQLSQSTPTLNHTSSLKDSNGILFGIEITSLKPNDSISSPVTVKGRANVFEGHVNLRVKDSDGTVLGTGFGTACMGDKPCPFEAKLTFKKSKGTTGTVEAYTVSAKDGSEQDLVSIQVKFKN